MARTNKQQVRETSMNPASRLARLAALAAFCGAAHAAVDFSEPVEMTHRLGKYSQSTLVVGADGALYGTAEKGGDGNRGTIFRVVPGGVATDVYDFDIAHGSRPRAGLLPMPDGSLWGTASMGGEHGRGVVFRFDPVQRSLEVIHAFDGVDGDYPLAPPMLAADGFVYGSTAGREPGFGGSVWRIDPGTRAFTLIRRFQVSATRSKLGRSPSGPIAQAGDGRLYGVNFEGGAKGMGTIYGVDPATLRVRLVHTFNDTDGCKAYGGLTAGPDGALFGATGECGATNSGTIYRLDRHAKFTVLHDFVMYADAYLAWTPLTYASDGYLYGGAEDFGWGSLYRIRPDGSDYWRFWLLGEQSEGITPYGAMLEYEGALWGTTSSSTVHGHTGSIYRIGLPVSPE
jgi:uncharacterized repeat protein (TIGR03803 family)